MPLRQGARCEVCRRCRRRYAHFVGILEAASRDSLDFIKAKAIRALGTLLAARPEQEGRLLGALVNKLGDPSRKLASQVRMGSCAQGVLTWVGFSGMRERCAPSCSAGVVCAQGAEGQPWAPLRP